jgi:hypothetical protein
MADLRGETSAASLGRDLRGTLPVLYQTASVLDRDRHADLRFAPQSDFAFAARTNSLPVVLSEFPELARFCPLALARGEDGDPVAVAVLGFGGGENRFVGPNGEWLGPYIPAWLRRYPFLLAQTGTAAAGHFVLAADLAARHFSATGGEPVFSEVGTSVAIGHAMGFCLRFEQELAATRVFGRTLDEARLLVDDGEEDRGAALAFLGIDHEALARVKPKRLGAWRDNGTLGSILTILASQRRWRSLADRHSGSGQAGQGRPE